MPEATWSNDRPSSMPTATAASAFSRLCRPGTASVSVPSVVKAVRRSPMVGAPAAPLARRLTVAVTLIGAIVTSVARTSAAAESRP